MKNPPQSSVSQSGLTCIEICSGAGGQAIGLERAGFEALAEEVPSEQWEVISGKMAFDVVEGGVRDFSAKEFKGVDLLAGGVHCPPFSKAVNQVGSYCHFWKRMENQEWHASSSDVA